MLITSRRYSEADLRLWREYEQADLAVVLPPGLVERTVEAIGAWVDRGGNVACTSWGKDSVVMLHLLSLAGGGVPAVWVRMCGRDNPDCERVRDAFLGEFPLDYHERAFRYEDCLHDEHWRAVAEEFGPRRMTGLRADESRTRRISIAVHGLDTGRSFRPLARWRAEWVFAYLAQKRLPVHPAYACLGGGRWPREHIRVHGIGGRRGAGAGRRQWEREYYPEVLARIASRTAEIRS